MSRSDPNGLSRRRVLKATSGTAVGLGLVGRTAAEPGEDHDCAYCTVAAAGEHHEHGEHGEGEHGDPVAALTCPDHPHSSTGPGHTMHHVNAAMGACPYGTGLSEPEACHEEHGGDPCTEAAWPDCTDWPQATIDVIEASREALTSPAYNNPGSLIALGYIPYFDVALPGPGYDGVSHWLNPRFIGDGNYEPTPWRPDSVILDNQWWKPLGPMYVATEDGDPHWRDEAAGMMEVRDAWGYENDCGECFPFHPHDGLPGRFAWWYYRQVHESQYTSGEPGDLTLPCYTAPMMHAWIYPTPYGPHGATSGAPPREYRPGGPPNRPGYPTPATPGEDELGLDLLPEAVQAAAMPDRLERELAVIEDLSTETLETTPIRDLEAMLDERLGPVDDSLDAIGSLASDLTDLGPSGLGL